MNGAYYKDLVITSRVRIEIENPRCLLNFIQFIDTKNKYAHNYWSCYYIAKPKEKTSYLCKYVHSQIQIVILLIFSG